MRAILIPKKNWLTWGIVTFVILVLTTITAISLLTQKPAEAYTTGFNAGRIIDDYIFTDTSTMNPSQIQDFLNSKVSSCDTNGTRPASDYGRPDLTHAQYAATRGWSAPPYTCLKDFSEGGRSAAQIIFDTSRQYGINPQVLVVLLQKEQGLVTDTWPVSSQYKTATGYGCPDTAACDSQYFGFTNQVGWASKMYRAVLDQSPTWYSPYVLGNNFILYNPDHSCGGSNVNIENLATVALYDYTPYQPNQASLDAGYGNGDACSAHGNRNFYSYFTDWFGRVTGPAYSWQLTGTEYYSDAARTTRLSSEPTVQPGGKIYIRVKARNNGNMPWDPSFVRLGTSNPRDHAGLYRDNSWPYPTRQAQLKEAKVTPSQTGTFEFSITAPSNPGSYREYFNVVAEGVTWLNDLGAYYNFNVVTPTAAPNPPATVLRSGETLDAKKNLVGPLGQTSLELQADGNLVLNHDYQPTWKSNTGGSQPKQLVMQTDGNLVLYNKAGGAMWSTGTGGHPGATLNLQDDGNMVIYSSTNSVLWTSGSSVPNYQSYVNDGQYGGEMFAYQQIKSADGRYTLSMQQDGNLVLYSPTRAIWQAGTSGKPFSRLAIQPDGNMVVYDMYHRPLWYTGTNQRDKLILQNDGNLVLYNGRNQPLWATLTNGQ